MIERFVMAVVAALLWATVAAAQDYLIRLGDRLDVSVLEDPAIGRQVLVRPDGRITLPLAGTLDAAGRTPEALAVAIRRALARDFVEPPTVTVAVVGLGVEALPEGATGAGTIYVLGQVGAPGRYDVALPIDILQMLAVAGGPGVFAATQRIQVRRRQSGDQIFLFDYDAVEHGTVPLTPIELRDGDVVVVPERGLFE
jgi:polysaccharide export outer membrane protein